MRLSSNEYLPVNIADDFGLIYWVIGVGTGYPGSPLGSLIKDASLLLMARVEVNSLRFRPEGVSIRWLVGTRANLKCVALNDCANKIALFVLGNQVGSRLLYGTVPSLLHLVVA